MEELIKRIDEVMQEERERAAKMYGEKFNSLHEAYAFIKEEFEEAMDEAGKFKGMFDEYWDDIKMDSRGACHMLEFMGIYAQHAAAEWVQVAGVCDKALAEYLRTPPKESEV